MCSFSYKYLCWLLNADCLQDWEGHHSHGWIPPLWYRQRRLPDDQGLLRRSQEEGGDSPPISAEADLSAGAGGYQAQVHRHLVQVWAWALPDHRREAEVLRQAQGLSCCWCQLSREMELYYQMVFCFSSALLEISEEHVCFSSLSCFHCGRLMLLLQILNPRTFVMVVMRDSPLASYVALPARAFAAFIMHLLHYIILSLLFYCNRCHHLYL